MRRLTPPPKEANFPKGLFKSLAWILAGDAYFEAQNTFDDSHVVILHQEGEELMMAQEVEDEVKYRVVRSCGCSNFRSIMFILIDRFHLPRIVENNWEKNLSAAADCYSESLNFEDSESEDTEDEDSESEDTEDEDSESEDTEDEDSESEDTEDEDSENEGSGFTKIAYRKIGFVWHECGRRLAELGWHAKDATDKYFRKAIKAFYRGNDVPNFELALCSRIEHHRKLAEFRETHQGPEGRIKTMEEARVKYQEALDLYSEAKNRLKKRRDGLHCKEVGTEEAHTYLKLGKFLMREDKQEDPNRNGQISAEEAIQEAMNLYIKLDRKQEVTHSQFQLYCILQERLLFESGKSDVTLHTEEADKYLKLGIKLMSQDKFYYDNQEKPNRKGQMSAEEALQKAIDLYQKLDCQQGVAYSQYRLGCALRDKLLFESLFESVKNVTRLEKKLTQIWLKALKYYLGVNDTDMFLRIRMEHSDLYLAMRLKSQMNKGLDQALLQLLEGCRAVVFNGSPVPEEFIRKLLDLLLTMCKAAKSQHIIASSSSPSKANDYKLLAEMYKCALDLKRAKGNDYRPLYSMWHNHAII